MPTLCLSAKSLLKFKVEEETSLLTIVFPLLIVIDRVVGITTIPGSIRLTGLVICRPIHTPHKVPHLQERVTAKVPGIVEPCLVAVGYIDIGCKFGNLANLLCKVHTS